MIKNEFGIAIIKYNFKDRSICLHYITGLDKGMESMDILCQSLTGMIKTAFKLQIGAEI